MPHEPKLLHELVELSDLTPALRQVPVTGLATDSRRVRPGYLFFALRGTRTDGHRFAHDALQKGAAALVVESAAGLPTGAPRVRVPDVLAALAGAARAFYEGAVDSLRLAAVTGTNGKTTTAFLLQAMLKAAGHPCGLIGTVHYQVNDRVIPSGMTTPDLLNLYDLLSQMAAHHLTHAVLEASSHALHQRRMEGLEVQCAVFTNLTRDHLDYHRTFEEYFDAKRRLFDSHLAAGGVAVINRDDPYGAVLWNTLPSGIRRTGFGTHPECDVTATDLVLSADGTAGRLHGVMKQPAAFRTRLVGRHNVYNVLAASAAAAAMGADTRTILQTLEDFPGVPGRLESIPCPRGFGVYVDYAHTDDALQQVLTHLRELHPARLWVVFGCGGDRDRTKRPLMGRVSAQLADQVVITSDNPRSEDSQKICQEIAEGALQIRPGLEGCVIITDRAAAISHALHQAQPGDIVLIAGKGHETVQIFRDVTQPFDDRQIARACLAQWG